VKVRRPEFFLLVISGRLTVRCLGAPQSPGDAFPSRYMGADLTLIEAPNGALADEELLEASKKILYTESATEKVGDGGWCIGRCSIANTTVIEGEGKAGLSRGDVGEISEFFELFDRFDLARNHKIPPLKGRETGAE